MKSHCGVIGLEFGKGEVKTYKIGVKSQKKDEMSQIKALYQVNLSTMKTELTSNTL